MDSVDSYTRSPLIAIELLGVLGALGSIPVAIIRAIYLLAKGTGSTAVVDLLLCPLALACIVAAAQIDAPTLLYGT